MCSIWGGKPFSVQVSVELQTADIQLLELHVRVLIINNAILLTKILMHFKHY